MVSTFFSRIASPAFGLMVFFLTVVSFSVIGGIAAPTAVGQEVKDQIEDDEEEKLVEKKTIHEPVHRVPKVASNSLAVPPATTNLRPTGSTNVAPKNVAPNATARTPAILPSATKIVPAPADPVTPSTLPAVDPTTEPNATPMKVPAFPASSVKPVVPAPAPHPLDDALATARRGLANMRTNIADYSAIMVKRERVNGQLLKPEYMQVKVRSEQVKENGQTIPFAIYLKFIKPRASAGREVIWIKGRNDGKMFVHEGSGIVSLKTFQLDPESWLAMKGQRYPIYEAGMENLIVKLIEKAERDRGAGDCEVSYRTGVKVNGRECDVIQVTHPEQRKPYDFHIAKVYIDKELRIPIRYQAHLWPDAGSKKPKLLEEYTYLNVKLNQGFTDEDFNPKNSQYSFP